MSKRTGAIVTMTLVAALLAGFGYWQFAGVGLAGGEDEEHEREEEREQRSATGLSMPDAGALADRLAARYCGRVIGMERENEGGRALYEVKLVDAEGR